MAGAAADHADAVAELEQAQAGVARLYAAWAEANRQAENPGPAPHQPGIGGLDALDAAGVQAITALFALRSLGDWDTAPTKPDRTALMRDQTRFRALNGNVIIPPRVPA